jgi:hypothetical protein
LVGCIETKIASLGVECGLHGFLGHAAAAGLIRVITHLAMHAVKILVLVRT